MAAPTLGGKSVHLACLQLRGTLHGRGSELYLGVWSAPLDRKSTGAAEGEVTAPGYTRVSVGPDAALWMVNPDGSASNARDVSFAEAEADWPPVRTFALLDALKGGNVLYYGPLHRDKVVQEGDQLVFPSGSLRIQEG